MPECYVDAYTACLVLLHVCAHECFEHLLYFSVANRWLMLCGIYGEQVTGTKGFTESVIFQCACNTWIK